jgi:hypothetical protein
MVSSGGGDPPCVPSGMVSCCGTGAAARFRGGLRLAALVVPAVGRRFGGQRRLALVRRFVAVSRLAALRRFGVDRFFRDAREVAACFLRFAM